MTNTIDAVKTAEQKAEDTIAKAQEKAEQRIHRAREKASDGLATLEEDNKAEIDSIIKEREQSQKSDIQTTTKQGKKTLEELDSIDEKRMHRAVDHMVKALRERIHGRR